MRKYKYVFFDTGSIRGGKVNKDDYFYMCNLDLRHDDNVEVISYPLEHLSVIYHKLRMLTVFIDNFFFKKCFFQRLWYDYYIHNNYKKNDKICFIVYGYYITPDYLYYLKEKFPNAKIVKLHRDSYDLWRKKNKCYTDDDIKSLFDVQLTYDKGDAKKYNMFHFDEIASKNEIEKSNKYPLFDLFFAGAVKDRLDILISVYDYLTKQGIRCWFFLTNPPKNKKIMRDGITYSNKNMTYKEMLYYTVNSKVILEINQQNVDGFTSRYLEAVMYNKKLITNNRAILQHKYYNPEYIQCFTNFNEIDVDFIKKEKEIDYKYQGDFSPVLLVDYIDSILNKLDSNETK